LSTIFGKNVEKENQIQGKRLLNETRELEDPKIMTFRALDPHAFKNFKITLEN
jgi:hypothetical protein